MSQNARTLHAQTPLRSRCTRSRASNTQQVGRADTNACQNRYCRCRAILFISSLSASTDAPMPEFENLAILNSKFVQHRPDVIIFIYYLHILVVYFLYVDESGQTTIKRSGNLFILSGVLVHEKDWKSIEKKLGKAKQELLPKIRPNEWELHAHAIWNDREIFANEELGLSFAKKKEIFSMVVDLACKSEITIINVIISKDRLDSSQKVSKGKAQTSGNRDQAYHIQASGWQSTEPSPRP